MAPRPTAEATQRVTPRQRRIEEQRMRIDTMRRTQRRKRAIWGTAVLIVAAVLIALVLLFVHAPTTTAAPGRAVPIEGTRTHLPQGSDITYVNHPPSSGDHYDQTAPYGVFDRPWPTGNWVHDLEHGGIVVLYNCPQSCPDIVDQLKDIYNSVPSSPYFANTKKMIVQPYTDMTPRIAAVAWGYEYDMDAVDKDAIIQFYKAHVDKGPEVGAL